MLYNSMGLFLLTVDYICVEIFWDSILFHQFTCPFFHQYYIVLITVSLQQDLKLGSVYLLSLFLFFNIVLIFLSFCLSILNLESICQYKQTNLLELLLEFYLIHTSIWEELTSYKHQIFLSMNMVFVLEYCCPKKTKKCSFCFYFWNGWMIDIWYHFSLNVW